MMLKAIYAASESCADLWYVSGFSAPDPFLWVDTPEGAWVIVSPLEYGRATKQAREDVQVLSYEEAYRHFGIPQTRGYNIVALFKAISTKYADAEWRVPESFPFGLASRLMECGLALHAEAPFCPERAVKTAVEVEKLRHGVRLAEAGVFRGFEVLRQASIQPDGVLEWNGAVLTAEILRGEIDIAIARRGGTASQTIAAPGVQGADPHQVGTGPIHANEPVVMDIFPRCDDTGYFGDLTRTVVKGHASDTVRRAFQVVYDAQKEAIRMIRPGALGSDVHQAVADTLTAHGFPTDLSSHPPHGFFHGLGHGVGLEIHEMPSLSPGYPHPLQPGNVVTVEPGVYYPEWGGIRIEDMVVVQESGCEDLTTAPVFLEID